MRRLITLCLAGTLTLTACTGGDGDDPTPSESPTTTASETETPTDEETSEATETPTATETTSEPTETETSAAGGAEDPTDEPEAEETAQAQREGDDAPSPAATEQAAVTPAEAKPVTEGPEDSVFSLDDSRTRRRTGSDCPVAPADDEQVLDCITGFSRSNDDRQSAVVVSRLSGTDTVTVYDGDGTEWRSALVATDLDELPEVRRAPWAGGDDAFVVDFQHSLELVVTSDPAGSRVAGELTDGVGGLSIELVARRVVVRMQELGPLTVHVLEPTPSGLVGTALTHGDDEDEDARIAEDVALRVYAAWVAGDPASESELMTADVREALEATPQDTDVFALSGTTCPVTDGAAVCTFRFEDATMRWEVRPVDGELKVVSLG